MKLISISVIDHGHRCKTTSLIADLLDRSQGGEFELIVTVNLKNDIPKLESQDERVKIIINESPKSFSSNHNLAFSIAKGDWFVALNPDVKLKGQNLGDIIRSCERFEGDSALFVPNIVDHKGFTQETLRRVPTPWDLIKRYFCRALGVTQHQRLNTLRCVANGPIMIFRASVFQELDGFDEKFRLYCEDIDISMRLISAGYRIKLLSGPVLEHDGQRESHKNIRYFFWHLGSLMKLWFSRAFFRYYFKLRRY